VCVAQRCAGREIRTTGYIFKIFLCEAKEILQHTYSGGSHDESLQPLQVNHQREDYS
jgi:hypothetical protein